MNKSMFKKRLTRAGLEKMLGGTFVPAVGEPGKRINGKWTTWTGPSELVEGQPAKFVRENGGHKYEGRKWINVARDMGLA